MTTEHQRIARIKGLLAPTHPTGAQAIEVGIGDDCAVLAEARGSRVWTIDSAVEHVHFRRDRMPLDAIGYRAFMAAASDLAAMGAHATAALTALTLPQSLTDLELDTLVAGIARAANTCACPIVGGNLARGGELSITTTVLGAPDAKALLRSAGRAGDALFVTGPIGGAALGMHALFAGVEHSFAPFVAAFLAPRARVDIAGDLARVASSAIDLSDGLLQDASHLSSASELTAVIELVRIPRLAGFDDAARTLKHDATATLVAGGEDYEVLFSAPHDADVQAWATRIGHFERGASEVRLLDVNGTRVHVASPGFDHFR